MTQYGMLGPLLPTFGHPMRKILIISILFSSLFADPGHQLNLGKISMNEFVKFVSRVTDLNFAYSEEELAFQINVISGKEQSHKDIEKLLFSICKKHGISTKKKGGYIHLAKKDEIIPGRFTSTGSYIVYKLQYHLGSEILAAMEGSELVAGLKTLKWIEGTNSLLFSGSEDALDQAKALIKSLDQPLKQVFIEVLVVESSIKNGSQFGVKWSGDGAYKDRYKANFGSPKLPLGKGFDFSIIGDLIFHQGKSFVNLSSLVSALSHERDHKIILNQKLLTQDTKSSTLFVGDNIPFPGAVVETIGASQQTTSNIEYKDVGVSLKITPLLGDDGVVTLDISEEITEALPSIQRSHETVQGIQTTKTNMITRVHVPDKSFVVLSGMNKNSKATRKEGIPCLGGIPLLGALFRESKKEDEKRHVTIFVRPHIVSKEEIHGRYRDETADNMD